MMPIYSSGVITARDEFSISESKEQLLENANEFEETPKTASGRTFNVTAMFCGLLATFDGEVAVRVTVPVYVPTCRAPGFAVMLRFAGDVAVVGLTSNQFPPVLVVPAT